MMSRKEYPPFRGSLIAKHVCVGLILVVGLWLAMLVSSMVTALLSAWRFEFAFLASVLAFVALEARLLMSSVVRSGDDIVVNNVLRSYRVPASAFKLTQRPGAWTPNRMDALHVRIGDRWVPVHAFSAVGAKSEARIRAFRKSGYRKVPPKTRLIDRVRKNRP